ncbi:MAG: ATP-binding protein [Blastocatellia bacterium]|nr:ATP-binding protein [Blastocatellia bacterium]
MADAKTKAPVLSLLLALALSIAPTVSTADSPSQIPRTPSRSLHQWGAVTLFHGLPSNHTRAIAQDREGVMWFGTDGGLVRYDGQRIQKAATDGPVAGRVHALRFDPEGSLWVGTEAGAVRLKDGRIDSIPETEGKTITAIITPSASRAVMASSQGVIFDCSISTDGPISVRTIGPDQHYLLTIDSDQRIPLPLTSLALAGEILIIGTRSRGLLAIEHNEVKEIPARPRAFFVEAIETDPQGHLWFGAQAKGEGGGLYSGGDPVNPARVDMGTGTVTSLCFDSRGGLWAGTDERGAFYYPASGGGASAISLHGTERFTFENTAGGMRSDSIYSIFVDREGVVWFGTDRGVCRYDPRSPSIETVSARPDSNFARAMFQASDGSLWCGTNSGLFIRDGRAATWLPVRELAGKTIHSIAEDSTGRLLVGTASGLFAGLKSPRSRSIVGGRRFARIETEESETAFGDSVRAICEFRGATYIASFGRGVERLDGERRSLVWPLEEKENIDGRERQVLSLHADKDKRLWISTAEAGVFMFDGNQVSPASSLDSLRDTAAWAIEGSGDDTLWLGTPRGLYALRREEGSPGSLRPIIEGQDVRAISVSAIGDEQSLLCATVGGGMFRVMIDERGAGVISQMTAEQGLPSENAFAVLSTRAASGEETLWIGTSHGVARYEPGRVAPNLRASRVMGKRVYQADEIIAGLELEYPQNSLALDVAATASRTFPDQFQYEFSLFDSASRVVRQRRARDSQFLMEGLRPGRYRVEARAYTNDLVASEPLAFEFTVADAPFPWTSTALSVLLALALAALWWGWHQNRGLARANDALGDANRQLGDTRLQLANETEAERRRIARDLHDQTLADLRRLLLLTDELHSGKSGNGQPSIAPSEFRHEIESIATEIRRIIEDLSPSALANVGLGAALEWALLEAVAHLPAERQFEYSFSCDDDLEERLNLAPGVRIQIYRIAQEAISNVCRHATATHARLSVAISPSGDFLLELEDDGRGFDPSISSVMTGRGLANMRSRASLIEAEVDWSNRSGGGTTFTLRRPHSGKAAV